MEDSSEVRNKKRLLMMVLAAEEEESSSDDETELQTLLLDDHQYIINSLLLSQIASKQTKRTCILNYVEQIVPAYTDDEFKMHFRVNRQLFMSLSRRFEEHNSFEDLRYDKRFPASKNLLVFLWFAGHEACSFRDVADRFDTSLSSVHRIIQRVTMFLSSLSVEVIRWPNSERIECTSKYFEDKTQFPKIIGAIDGTHIIIDPPKNGKDDYIDRKGQTSFCLQAICDENKKFIDIFVGYPGSVHDSRVFQNSFFYPKLENICKDYYILGDSAYPVMKILLTPFKDNGHLTPAQKHFNGRLSSCRVVIEHSFGMLKQRFRQLYYCKLRGMKKLCHFVRACCVLHNLASEDDLDFIDPEKEADLSEEVTTPPESEGVNTTGKAMRDFVCQQLWEKYTTQ